MAKITSTDYQNWQAITAPALSAATEGRIIFNTATNKFQASESGGAYVNLIEGTTGSGWQDDGTVVRLQTLTDFVGIGTATPSYLNTVASFAVNDYIEVLTVQSSGGALNVGNTAQYAPVFWAQRIA